MIIENFLNIFMQIVFCAVVVITVIMWLKDDIMYIIKGFIKFIKEIRGK